MQEAVIQVLRALNDLFFASLYDRSMLLDFELLCYIHGLESYRTCLAVADERVPEFGLVCRRVVAPREKHERAKQQGYRGSCLLNESKSCSHSMTWVQSEV